MDIYDILNKNRNKNFVKRIINPEKSINLDGGRIGTHLMASGEIDGRHIVYPTIIEKSDGELYQLGNKEAVDYAIKNKEFIEFKSQEEAEWFGQHYKDIWKEPY